MERGQPFVATCSPKEARAQMLRMHGIDKSKLEIGGRGPVYIKVWRKNELLLWWFFEPSESGELVAYERATQTMVDNPGAQWAVSCQCGYACAGLPRMWNEPLENGPLSDAMIVALERLYAAKGRGLIVDKHDDGCLLALADYCLAFEVEPSKWRITGEGKRVVEDRRDAERAKLGEVAS
jgi:hypothetical protein